VPTNIGTSAKTTKPRCDVRAGELFGLGLSSRVFLGVQSRAFAKYGARLHWFSSPQFPVEPPWGIALAAFDPGPDRRLREDRQRRSHRRRRAGGIGPAVWRIPCGEATGSTRRDPTGDHHWWGHVDPRKIGTSVGGEPHEIVRWAGTLYGELSAESYVAISSAVGSW
jgi:hypothetical protein